MRARRPVIAALLAAASAPVAFLPRSSAVDPGYGDEVKGRIAGWKSTTGLQKHTTGLPEPTVPVPVRNDSPVPSPIGGGTVMMRCFAVNAPNLNTAAYAGMSAAPLRAPSLDAAQYARFGQARGYNPQSFINQEATAGRLLSEIRSAAQTLRTGDTFILTFAGHGSHIKDVNGDENGGDDSTWLLFDREIIDDELAEAWTQFQEGVLIVAIVDACHSGTSTRAVGRANNQGQQKLSIGARALADPRGEAVAADGTTCRVRTVSRDDAKQIEANHLNDPVIAARFASVPRGDQSEQRVRATVLTLAACQDDQTASESPTQGFFTRALLDLAGTGQFTGSYNELLAKAGDRVGDPNQTPKVTAFGGRADVIRSERPFGP